MGIPGKRNIYGTGVKAADPTLGTIHAEIMKELPKELRWEVGDAQSVTPITDPVSEKSYTDNKWELYPTPKPMITAFFRQAILDKSIPHPTKVEHILDVGAGTGNWGNVAKLVYPNATLHGVELDESLRMPLGFDEWIVGNYLNIPCPPHDLTICNPPFSLYGDFLTKLQQEHQRGHLICFFSTARLVGEKNVKGFWDTKPPSWMYIYTSRIKWRGGSDMWGRCVAVWDGTEGSTTVTRTRWIRSVSYRADK